MSTAYTQCFEVPTWHCCLAVVCTCTDANRLNFEPVTIGHTHHSNSCIVQTKSRVYVQWQCSSRARTSILSDYRNRCDREQTTLPLCKRLGGLLNMALKHKALHASALRMHLHDYPVCAHSPTVLINPEHSESASFKLVPGYPTRHHALQVMTQTI